MQVPTIDVVDVDFVLLVLAIVGVRSGEVAYSLIGHARRVAGVLRNFTDGVVERLQIAATVGHFEGQFDILRKGLGFDDLG